MTIIINDTAFGPTPKDLVRKAFASFMPTMPASGPLSFGERHPAYMAPAAARDLIRLSMLRRAEILAERGDVARLFPLLDRIEAFDRDC